MVADNTIEEGRLSSPIGADQTDDFTLIDIEGDVIIGNHSAKVLDKINDLEKDHVYPVRKPRCLPR
jgi:hypothetical protein